jgi:hypothetical protein
MSTQLTEEEKLLDERGRLRQSLQQILANTYILNVSEDALQILYWCARIREGMEDQIENLARLYDALAGRFRPACS